MKILHFIDSGGLYGAESVILNLSREMLTYGNYIPVVGCIVSQSEGKSDLYDKANEFGIVTEKLVLRNPFLFVDIVRVARKLKKMDIALIHSHGYKPSVLGFLIRLLTGIPVIATCHLWFLQGKIPLKMRAMIRAELLLYRFFPVVVAVSEPIKKTICFHGVDPNKVSIIKNGIAIEDYSFSKKHNNDLLREELKLQAGELCFLNVARLSRQKAQWQIVSAAQKLLEEGVKARFFIVGEGHLRDDLSKLISDHGLQNCVHLLGFRRDIKELLQIADVFLLPSLDEGMPMALLEAAASQIPIVTTPVGDIPKLIKNNYSGLFVKVGVVEDLVCRIKRLVNSKSLRKYLSINAYNAVVHSYSSKEMYKQYDNVYKMFFT